MSLILKKINQISKTDIAVILFILIIIIFAINGERNKKNLVNNSRYTIGTTVRRTTNRFGESFIYYKYSVEGIEFISSQSYEKVDIKKEQRYYVVFQCDKPKNSRLLINSGVVVTVDSIPFNGWKELPPH